VKGNRKGRRYENKTENVKGTRKEKREEAK
jgi:hypothetical protein